MKIKDIVTEQSGIVIKNSHGILEADWKTDLLDEEDDDYLPDGYDPNKVLELKYVEAKELGKGNGESLMEKFLSSQVAKSAELIFLDPNPYMGKFEDSALGDNEQIARLHRFYKKFGFESKHNNSGRMWKVQKGSISKNDLPT
jgi:hypothetical protein